MLFLQSRLVAVLLNHLRDNVPLGRVRRYVRRVIEPEADLLIIPRARIQRMETVNPVERR
jgi:hypothetical protein